MRRRFPGQEPYANDEAVNRREFLKKSAAGSAGLVIGFYLPGKYEALAGMPPKEDAPFNAWVQIAPDDSVTLVIDKSEMGQGISTALAMILAEELDLDWKKIQTEFAPAAPPYFNPVFGLQGTGGSTSVRGSWEPLAKAGAAAREMLVATAAKRWDVAPEACHVENGAVVQTPPASDWDTERWRRKRRSCPYRPIRSAKNQKITSTSASR